MHMETAYIITYHVCTHIHKMECYCMFVSDNTQVDQIAWYMLTTAA